MNTIGIDFCWGLCWGLHNRFLTIKQRDEYNWNKQRIRSEYYPSSNILIGYKDLIIYKLCYIHKGLEENIISKDIRNIIYHKYLIEYNEILYRWYYEYITRTIDNFTK